MTRCVETAEVLAERVSSHPEWSFATNCCLAAT